MSTTPDGYPQTAALAITGMANTQSTFVPNLLDKRSDLYEMIPEGWTGTKALGDAHEQLSDWSVTGATMSNTDAGTLYWNLTNSGSTRTVNAYKDSAEAAGDLVLQGTSSGDGTITLAEQNSSGLSGSVTVAYTTDDTDSANLLLVRNVELSLEILRRGPLYEAMVDDLLRNPAFPKAKIEYFEAFEDLTAFKDVELWKTYVLIMEDVYSANSESADKELLLHFREMHSQALHSSKIQVDEDTLATITETDTADIVSPSDSGRLMLT